MKRRILLAVFLFTIFFLPFLVTTVQSWTGTYHLEHEWVKIWINQDGTIDLQYDIHLTLDSGDSISRVYVGQPKRDFTIGEAFNEEGSQLSASDASSGSDYKVQVTLMEALGVGESAKFSLITNVAGMLYNDTMNIGNIGMQFTPSWYNAEVNDLRIQFVLPPNLTSSEVKTTQEAYWNNTATEDDRLTVYWETQNLLPNEQYPVGISFPNDYLPDFTPEQPSADNEFGIIVFAVVGVIVASLAVGIAIYFIQKKPYNAPKLSMETLGIRRGLTAVEASYLLEMKPTQIVTEILYGLLQKRAVWTETTKPSLKLKIMPEFEDKKGTAEKPLRYYEIDFLRAVRNNGTLEEEKLAHTVMFLRDTVEQKLRGYSRRDTEDYYRKITVKAWAQVEQAGTPELASKAYDEQLLWLLLDPKYRSRTEAVFQNLTFEPDPLWFWYWYGYRNYHPNPTYKPNIGTTTQPSKTPTIPGADFANNIATAVEKTSSNIVLSIEKFANAILPAPPPVKSSRAPTRRGSDCVCACHACACACACVSCACACAGGGVG